MPVLTITTTIQLPADEWERADLVALCKPLPGVVREWMADNKVEGTVEHSFDGRKARTPAEPKPIVAGAVELSGTATGDDPVDEMVSTSPYRGRHAAE